eukprot:TRINITY_DN3271_c0_g1_i2.p1 TRINITY_DN3271_c0_g1~~TRINITY_DN3271_c0_g1_i2.p1  ORF type:complete len:231 (-),score=53.20 TRINITY_DN3271_c0_g1_i2:26-718(-)
MFQIFRILLKISLKLLKKIMYLQMRILYVPDKKRQVISSLLLTKGAHRLKFTLDDVIWEIYDVGGQSPERKKWDIIIDQGINGVIYFVACDEFNVISPEEPDKTKFEQSLNVFTDIASAMVERGEKLLIVFLNKIDLFDNLMRTEKGKSEFMETFPGFKKICKKKGMMDNEDELIEEGLEYIENEFREVAPTELDLVFYPTCALDQNQLKNIFDAVRESIFLDNMKEFVM